MSTSACALGQKMNTFQTSNVVTIAHQRSRLGGADIGCLGGWSVWEGIEGFGLTSGRRFALVSALEVASRLSWAMCPPEETCMRPRLALLNRESERGMLTEARGRHT